MSTVYITLFHRNELRIFSTQVVTLCVEIDKDRHQRQPREVGWYSKQSIITILFGVLYNSRAFYTHYITIQYKTQLLVASI